MTPLDFIYQDTEIHFLLGNNKNVMVNATEMAKAFGKRLEDFKRLEGTKTFIKELLKFENSRFVHADVREQDQILLTEKDIVNATNKGTYFHRSLALKFAAWLDVQFELWVYNKIDEVLFGNYKKHWDEHVNQESARIKMEVLKSKLTKNPTLNDALEYFKAEQDLKNAKTAKMRAIKDQYQNQYNLDFLE